MTHHAAPDFWNCYHRLPPEIQALADKSFTLLKTDAKHPSLRFKKLGSSWSVRVGLHYRALGKSVENGVLWFWIGSHADYDDLLR